MIVGVKVFVGVGVIVGMVVAVAVGGSGVCEGVWENSPVLDKVGSGDAKRDSRVGGGWLQPARISVSEKINKSSNRLHGAQENPAQLPTKMISPRLISLDIMATIINQAGLS